MAIPGQRNPFNPARMPSDKVQLRIMTPKTS